VLDDSNEQCRQMKLNERRAGGRPGLLRSEFRAGVGKYVQCDVNKDCFEMATSEGDGIRGHFSGTQVASRVAAA